MSWAASTSAPYPCPDLDGSSYTDTTGSSYNIQCGTDYPDNDLPAIHADTFEECLKGCDTYVPAGSPEADNYASCIGVSWEAVNPAGNCYLKYQITAINTNDVGLSSGYLINYTLPESAMVDLGSSPPAMITPAISSIQAATSTALPEPILNDGSDSHVAIDVDAATSSSLAAISTTLPTSSPKDGSENHVAVGIDAATVSTYAATSKIQAAASTSHAATSKNKAANSTTLPTSTPSGSPDSHVAIEVITATSSTHAATSPILPTPSGDLESHVAIGVGAGVGIGVPIGSAILACVFYLMRRQSKARPEGPMKTDAEADINESRGSSEPSTERQLDELPAKNKPRELCDPRGPRAELFEIRGIRAEMG